MAVARTQVATAEAVIHRNLVSPDARMILMTTLISPSMFASGDFVGALAAELSVRQTICPKLHSVEQPMDVGDDGHLSRC